MRLFICLVSLAIAAPALAQTPAPQAQQPPGFTAPAKAEEPKPAATSEPNLHSLAEVKKAVRSGRSVFIGSYVNIDKSCKIGKQPTVEVVQKPASGQARVRRDSYNLRNAPGVPRNKCLGVSPEGIAVVYAAKSGFKGEDRFEYKVTFDDGRTRNVMVTVTVQ